jgi:hypothetical protein
MNKYKKARAKLKYRHIGLNFGASVILLNTACHLLSLPGQAQLNSTHGSGSQEILGNDGQSFMEEESPAPARKKTPNARVNILNSDKRRDLNSLQTLQTVEDSHAGIFMQEINDHQPAKSRRAYVDLSRVGVPVDPSGKIIPVRDESGATVRENFSNTQAYQEMPVPTINATQDNPLALPFTMNGQRAPVGTAFVPVTPSTVPILQPSYNAYTGTGSLNPYSVNSYSPLRPLPYYGGPPSPYSGSPISPYYPGFPAVYRNRQPPSAISLPMPIQSSFNSASRSSSLVTPILRDPANSTGDLLEDAKRAGLWSNSAGSGSSVINQGLFGGRGTGSSEQHQTGVSSGSGLK